MKRFMTLTSKCTPEGASGDIAVSKTGSIVEAILILGG
jgi:hypothetical protein